MVINVYALLNDVLASSLGDGEVRDCIDIELRQLEHWVIANEHGVRHKQANRNKHPGFVEKLRGEGLDGERENASEIDEGQR